MSHLVNLKSGERKEKTQIGKKLLGPEEITFLVFTSVLDRVFVLGYLQ